MTDILLVARRELIAQTRTKGFVIGLALSALVVAAIIAVPQLISSDDSYDVGVVGAESLRLEPVINEIAAQSGVTVEVDQYADEPAATAAIEDGDLDAVIVNAERLVSADGIDLALEAILQGAHTSMVSHDQLVGAGLDLGEIEAALAVDPLESVILNGDEDSGAREAVAFLMVLALFFLIFGSATMVAIGVVEEKSSRIVEILLIAVRPWQLLAGKIAAFIVLGLIQLVVFVAAGLGAAAAVGAFGDVPPGMVGIVATALVGFLLGFLFYAATAAALASLVSRQEEVNQVLGPMMMTIMASYFVSIWALNSPGSSVADILSMTPPFSAMVMPVRVATGDASAWQIAVATAAMVAAVTIMLYVGGRIYERAVLRTGARLRPREVIGSH
jgi:ABC-2 type transport system permease protein